MKKILLILIAMAIVLLSQWQPWLKKDGHASLTNSKQSRNRTTSSAVASKYHSNQQVSGSGIVSKILPDDTKGSRHQRFIIQQSDGQTLLIAHNIDLAPKIPNLKQGDTVDFYGEYEANNRGGVIHWTHRDPAHRHTDGWLKHQGQLYQ